MAKTFKNLYPQIYDYENLYRAYLKARTSKQEKPDVLRFTNNLEEELIQLQNELIWHEYQLGEYRCFEDPGPPVRQIAALPFRDRVIQHAVVNVIEPIWEARFVYDSYACRKNRGSVAAVYRVQDFLKKCQRDEGRVYVFQSDIKSYFNSIRHTLIKGLLANRIACKETLQLLNLIIDSSVELFGVPCGIPKGSLTSQLIANIILHELDEFIKYELRERHYVRYMDDFVVITGSKQHAQDVRKTVAGFLDTDLHLAIHPKKTKVFPVRPVFGQPVNFCGYRIWPTHIEPRKKNTRAARKRLRTVAMKYSRGLVTLKDATARVMSFLGYMKHCNGYRTTCAVLDELVLKRKN